jgi:hypothetical protein
MVRLPSGYRQLQCVAALALAIVVAGCSLRTPESWSGAASDDADDITGVWEGLAVDDCSFRIIDQNRCATTVRIMLTLIQQDSAVSGFYKCATDTTACRIEEEGGRIAGELTAGNLAFRLMLPDGTGCMYRAVRSGGTLRGGYFCLGGSIILERGWFEAQRSY